MHALTSVTFTATCEWSSNHTSARLLCAVRHLLSGWLSIGFHCPLNHGANHQGQCGSDSLGIIKWLHQLVNQTGPSTGQHARGDQSQPRWTSVLPVTGDAQVRVNLTSDHKIQKTASDTERTSAWAAGGRHEGRHCLVSLQDQWSVNTFSISEKQQQTVSSGEFGNANSG